MRTLVLIKYLLKDFKFQVGFAVVLLLLQALIGATVTFSIGPAIDLLMDPELKNVSEVTKNFLILAQKLSLPIGLLTFLFIFLFFQSLKSLLAIYVLNYNSKLKYDFMINILRSLLDKIFKARWEFFSSSSQGYLYNSVNEELKKVGNSFITLANYLSSFIQLIVYLIIPLIISVQTTLIFLVTAGSLYLPLLLLSKLGYKIGSDATRTANQYSVAFEETFSGAKTILGYNKAKESIKRIVSSLVEHKKFAVKSYTLGISLQESTIPLGVISLIVTLYFTKTSNIQISDLGIIVWSLKNVASSASILLSSKTNVETIFPSFEQLQSIEKKAQSFELKNGSLKFEKLEQGISIEQVVFAYPARDQVLRNVTLFIPKHKMIALVGKSGSGKSTLVDLILGFQLPDSGQINFDNTDLRLLDIASLRDKMGYVPQDPVLFNMTIRENLLWSNPHASNEDLWLACEMAYATEFIKNLPLGLDTNIGDKGVKFSGGQKQRLALARAIIRKPELLILDEATSALDSESEKSIQKAIETISKNTTTIIIAHRLSTIQNADCIYFIHEGKILESGTYQELSSSNSKFKEKFLI